MKGTYILQQETNVEFVTLNVQEIAESEAISEEDLIAALQSRAKLIEILSERKRITCRTIRTITGQLVAEMYYAGGNLVELSIDPALLAHCKQQAENINEQVRRPRFFNSIRHDRKLLDALNDMAERLDCEELNPETRIPGLVAPGSTIQMWSEEVLRAGRKRGLLVTDFMDRNLSSIAKSILTATAKMNLSPRVIAVA